MIFLKYIIALVAFSFAYTIFKLYKFAPNTSNEPREFNYQLNEVFIVKFMFSLGRKFE